MNPKKKDGTPSDSKNEPLPGDFEEKAKQRFKKLKEPGITYEDYLKHETNEFQRQKALEKKPALRYKPTIGKITPCGNGDFEERLDTSEWQGAYGSLQFGIDFGNLTAGIVSGAITSPQAHQTWVSPGLDPNVSIPTTAPGSSGAVRIGNAYHLFGIELLSKTFVVTFQSSSIKFWYAVVLENPVAHPADKQPLFWVRVTDASGNIVPGAFDFGDGSDKLIADMTNPFFQTKEEDKIVYKDWTCAQIDLSTQIGKQVTVEFVTGDCGYSQHWGYAYIDNFCGDCEGSSTGNIAYNCEESTHCGPGRLCFDYLLPKIGEKTGSIIITLDIFQNGTLLTQLTSPMLTKGSSYCFSIEPTSIPGLNATLNGFDFVATGSFAVGSSPLGSINVGTAPDGIVEGQNNDYQIACKSCEDIGKDQDEYLTRQCTSKVNLLPLIDCNCLDSDSATESRNDCVELNVPDIKPLISVAWGDSPCDCLETDDVEVLCITVCNRYSNVTFNNLSIGQIQITDIDGNPVPTLPDGTPSVQVFPSGPICFGDIGPCEDGNRSGCVSRELVLYTRGAIGKKYRLLFDGICFTVTHHFQSEQCFIVKLCQD